jgi:hypothetical protein
MGVRSTAVLAAGLVLSALVAGPAAATTIAGAFTGIVFSSDDETNVFGAGTGVGTLDGQTVTGAFSYVFEDVPGDQCGGGNACYADFYGALDWLKISVTINGATFVISPEKRYEQALYNSDKATVGYDFFQVYEDNQFSDYDPIANASIYQNRSIPTSMTI